MNTGELKISASVDDYGYCDYNIIITKGRLLVHVHFWGEPLAFNQFGEGLRIFPRNQGDVVKLELGRDTPFFNEENLLLKAFCYDANGHAALKVITHNNALEPHTLKMEFTIPTEIAALNKLDMLLHNWQPKADSEVIWAAQVS